MQINKAASPIKSIQRGSSQIAVGQSSLTVTVSSVNLSKSMLVMNSRPTTGGAGASMEYGTVSGKIASSTSLSFSRASSSATYTANVEWELVEYV